MPDEIQLLQFFICREFREEGRDAYQAEGLMSNLRVPAFPFYFENTYAVTCWRKDRRFHKEVIEYTADDGASVRSPHMDIEPVTDSVLFRWHKHRFPSDFAIKKPAILTVRVLLDGHLKWNAYILIEKTA